MDKYFLIKIGSYRQSRTFFKLSERNIDTTFNETLFQTLNRFTNVDDNNTISNHFSSHLRHYFLVGWIFESQRHSRLRINWFQSLS